MDTDDADGHPVEGNDKDGRVWRGYRGVGRVDKNAPSWLHCHLPLSIMGVCVAMLANPGMTHGYAKTGYHGGL